MSINYLNLSASKSYKGLVEAPKCSIKAELTPDRIEKYTAAAGAGLSYNYAGKKVNDSILELLKGIANEQQLIEKYKSLLNGDYINTGENRMVLHHHTREMKLDDVMSDEIVTITRHKNLLRGTQHK